MASAMKNAIQTVVLCDVVVEGVVLMVRNEFMPARVAWLAADPAARAARPSVDAVERAATPARVA